MRRTHSEERLLGEHEGPQVQALVLARRHPVAVDGDQLSQRLQEVRHRQFGQCEAACGALQAAPVLVGAERVDRAVRVPVRLDALEDLLAVVQHGCGGVEGDRAVRLDARAMPAAADRPADVDHVVGEVRAEAGVDEDRLALRGALRGEVSGDGELERCESGVGVGIDEGHVVS